MRTSIEKLATSFLYALVTFPCPEGLRCPGAESVADVSLTDVNNFIVTVINWLVGVTFALTVLFLIIGGLQFMTSAGNEERVTRARGTVINAIIGMIFVILAYVIATSIANFVSTGS